MKKRRLFWIGLVIAALVGAWLLGFGGKGPCDAFRAEAAAVAAREGGAYQRAVKEGILDRADLGTWQCFSGAVQLKLRGADAITVVTVDGKPAKRR